MAKIIDRWAKERERQGDERGNKKIDFSDTYT